MKLFERLLNEFTLENVKSEKFNKEETARAIRQAQIAELDAVNTYLQIADSVSDPKIKKIFIDIAEEEMVHKGEFEKAMNYLMGSEDDKNSEKGRKEAEDKGL